VSASESEEFEWGWITISEFVSDGVSTWLETRRFLYYSPDEARERFNDHVKDNGWRIADD
jgi:hypothetical protein